MIKKRKQKNKNCLNSTKIAIAHFGDFKCFPEGTVNILATIVEKYIIPHRNIYMFSMPLDNVKVKKKNCQGEGGV